MTEQVLDVTGEFPDQAFDLADEVEEEAPLDVDPTNEPALHADLVALKAAKTKKSQLELDLKVCNKELETLRLRITTVFEARGITNMRVTGVGMVYSKEDLYCTVVDNEGLNKWLADRGEDALIKHAVNPQTLKAYLKERREGGLDLPPEAVIKIYEQKNVALRK